MMIADIPRVWVEKRAEIIQLDQGITQVILRYGFMENPNVPRTLQNQPLGFDFNPEGTTYYVGSQTLIPTISKPGMALWRRKLFAFMIRNSVDTTAAFGIPPGRVIELGMQIEI